MKLRDWIGLFLPAAVLWGIVFDSSSLYPNLGVVALFFTYAIAVHEMCSHAPQARHMHTW